jgi:predicted ATP-grasp superfamily ATP-dependent carboligase
VAGELSAAQRRELPVLVPDAHAIGMIAVIRSLGRAGYPVHACASRPDALGLDSSFAAQRAVYPAYDDPAFLDWLARYVREHGIRSIVPSEGFLLAVRPVFEHYAPLLPLRADPALVYGSLSKSAVVARLLEQPATAAHLPPTLLVAERDPEPAEAALAALGLPLFVKADGADDRFGDANVVVREDSPAAALARLRTLRQRYTRVLVQGFVPGQGTGAYFLVRDGEIRQEFMNRCLHEVPHTGGYCSLRESWWHAAMMDDARTKIRHLGWEGVAMLEYRWDPVSDRFWFIELNARFWAALHLALYAGVDFPTMLLDGVHGGEPRRVERFPLGLRCRYTVPFDLGYVVSRWRDPGLSLASRMRSVAGWFVRFLDPSMHSDLLFPGDRKLYFSQWRSFLRQLAPAWATRRAARPAPRGNGVGGG